MKICLCQQGATYSAQSVCASRAPDTLLRGHQLADHQHPTSMVMYATCSTLIFQDLLKGNSPAKSPFSNVPPSWTSDIHCHKLVITTVSREHTASDTSSAIYVIDSTFPYQCKTNMRMTTTDTQATYCCNRRAKQTLQCRDVHHCCRMPASTARPPRGQF